MSQALQILQQTFGYSQFRDQQSSIIDGLIAGKHQLVIMPTGGGKSLCYQIPSLIREGVGVVVSPLIALMQDQVSALREHGIRAAFLNSTLSSQESHAVQQQVMNGELDILYVAPERVATDSFQHLMHQSQIALFAIDECHCVSQWGHDFRPDYIHLGKLAEQFPTVPRIALTATADELTRNEIVERLFLHDADIHICGFDRPNIQYRVMQTGGNAKEALLDFIRQEYPRDAGVVYCLSRKKVEQTAKWLREKGLNALPYHAGLSSQEREKHQSLFLRDEGVIIVATIAFGMGIDKPDVRFVAHLNLPKSIEAYYQETGRAGRDGEPATAWMNYGLNDVITLRQMLEQSDTPEQQKRIERHKLDNMLSFAEHSECRRQYLLAYFGENLPEPCGNCDVCLHPVEQWDASVVAQKALSAVYRTGQRFGVNHLVDVLLGKETPKVKQLNHNQLSVFGVGGELDVAQWRSVFRQLVAKNYLQVDLNGYGGLQLTESCRPVLKGEQSLFLRKDSIVTVKRKSKKTSSKKKTGDALFNALKEKRRELALEHNLAPYMVFHDATLLAMAEYQPRSKMQMATLSGVGDKKLERYGQAFIEVIEQFIEQQVEASESASETLKLILEGKSIEEVAQTRELKVSTVWSHAAQAIAQDKLSLHHVLDIPEAALTQIHDSWLEHQAGESPSRLKPIYDDFGGEYSYDWLKCIAAHFECQS